jgi:hypothetical protein
MAVAVPPALPPSPPLPPPPLESSPPSPTRRPSHPRAALPLPQPAPPLSPPAPAPPVSLRRPSLPCASTTSLDLATAAGDSTAPNSPGDTRRASSISGVLEAAAAACAADDDSDVGREETDSDVVDLPSEPSQQPQQPPPPPPPVAEPEPDEPVRRNSSIPPVLLLFSGAQRALNWTPVAEEAPPPPEPQPAEAGPGVEAANEVEEGAGESDNNENGDGSGHTPGASDSDDDVPPPLVAKHSPAAVPAGNWRASPSGDDSPPPLQAKYEPGTLVLGPPVVVPHAAAADEWGIGEDAAGGGTSSESDDDSLPTLRPKRLSISSNGSRRSSTLSIESDTGPPTLAQRAPGGVQDTPPASSNRGDLVAADTPAWGASDDDDDEPPPLAHRASLGGDPDDDDGPPPLAVRRDSREDAPPLRRLSALSAGPAPGAYGSPGGILGGSRRRLSSDAAATPRRVSFGALPRLHGDPLMPSLAGEEPVARAADLPPLLSAAWERMLQEQQPEPPRWPPGAGDASAEGDDGDDGDSDPDAVRDYADELDAFFDEDA